MTRIIGDTGLIFQSIKNDEDYKRENTREYMVYNIMPHI